MKVVIFTHNADIDGMGCAILAKLCYGEENCDIVFTTPHTVNDDFINFFGIEKTYDDDEEKDTYNIYSSDNIRDYDRIFITDLSINGELFNRVIRNNIAGSKLRIFDHHELNEKNGVSGYLNANVKISDFYGLCSGTSLFSEYLKKKCGLNQSKILDDFVEKVRRQDTWEWKTKYNDTIADDLAQYFNAVGKTKFIKSMLDKINNNPNSEFFFTEEESEIIENYKKQINQICEDCIKTMSFSEINGIKFGIGNLPYKFRNEMAEYIRNIKLPIDVFMLPNYDGGSCSFRSINPNVDVNEIAIAYGGGGHKNASSCPINPKLVGQFNLVVNSEEEPNC